MGRIQREITPEIIYSYAKAIMSKDKTLEDIQTILLYKKDIETNPLYRHIADVYFESLEVASRLNFNEGEETDSILNAICKFTAKAFDSVVSLLDDFVIQQPELVLGRGANDEKITEKEIEVLYVDNLKYLMITVDQNINISVLINEKEVSPTEIETEDDRSKYIFEEVEPDDEITVVKE